MTLLFTASPASGQPASTSGATSSPSSNSSGDGDPSAPRGTGQTAVVLWIFHRSEKTGDLRATFESNLRSALSGERRRHLVGTADLETYLSDHPGQLPLCFEGLSECVSPETAAHEQIGLNTVIRVSLSGSGAEGPLRARYELLDRRGRVSERSSLKAPTPKKLAFEVARAVFDVSSAVTIETKPSGATVFIDGDRVGTSPVQTRLPIGEHSYRLELTKYRPVEGTFEVTGGESTTVDRSLQREPGLLVVEEAPENATVSIDGENVGRAGEEIELQPGKHELVVRADGHESHRETVEIQAGETIRRSIPLERDNPLLRSVDQDQIAVNHYVARLTFDQSIHPSSFRDARGSAGGTNYEFDGFTDGARPTLAPNGLRLDLAYTGRHFGVTALSISYLGMRRIDERVKLQTGAGDTTTASVESLRRLQLRPFQLTYRHLFRNIAPSIELGTGIAFQWVDVEPNSADRLTLSRTEAFWTLGIGAQYFFNANWFASLRYHLQDYFNPGLGAEHVVSLGGGVALPNLFGFEPEPPEEL
ncbi:MAG: PEGA domain-containing protein [Bradymonadaceae bacterium]